MADYDLGTARGRIEVDSSGAEYGIGRATAATKGLADEQGAAADKMIKSGAIMVGGAAAIGAGFAVAINAAADFEQRISGIAAVSGATEDELESIRKKALQLGADTKFSASESAGAMEELIKAGLTVGDVMNGAADATVNLAAAGEIDLTSAATIAANAMNTFNLAAEDLPKVADLIAGAANASAIDVSEFAQAMQQSGAVANLVGLDFDDLSVAIAAMGNAGIKGSDAGTSLKTFLSNLQPVTKKQTELFAELGLVTADGANQFFTAEGSIKSMSEIAGVLSKSLEGMTDAQKQAALETLFGSDAIRAAAIIADTGAQGFDDLAESMGKVTAAEVAETRMDNLAGSIEQLKGSVETLLIIVGIPLAKALRVWVDRITDVVNWISGLDEGTLSLVTTIAKMVAVFAGVVGTILIVAGAIQKLRLAFFALNLVMRANPVGAVITILLALGAALYTLYTSNETFREAVQKLFGYLARVAGPIVKTVIDAFEQLYNIFVNRDFTGGPFAEDSPFINAMFVARDLVLEVADNVKRFFSVLTSGDIEGIGTPVEEFALTLRDTLLPILETVWSFLQDNFKPILIGIGVAIALVTAPFLTVAAAVVYAYLKFQVFRDVVRAVANFFVDTIIPAVETVAKILLWLATEIIERLVGAFDWFQKNVWPVLTAFAKLIFAVGERVGQVVAIIIAVIQKLKPVFDGAFGAMKVIIETFVTIAMGLWKRWADNIWQVIQFAFNTVKTVIEGAMKIIQGVIQVLTGIISLDWQTTWEGIKNIVQGVWDIIQEIPGIALKAIHLVITNALNAFISLFEVAWDLIKGGVRLLWAQMRGLFGSGFDTVMRFIRSIPTAIGSLATTIWNGFKNGASSAIDSVVGFFRALPGRITALAGAVGSAALSIGQTIIRKLGEGVRGAVSAALDFAGAVARAVKDVMNSIIRRLNDAFDFTLKGPGPLPDLHVNLPDIPQFHGGGTFRALPGEKEGVALLSDGETVFTPEQMAMLRKLIAATGDLVGDLLMATRSMQSTSMPTAPSEFGGASGGDTFQLAMSFPNVGSAQDVEEIKSALSDPSVISDLVSALKGGTR